MKRVAYIHKASTGYWHISDNEREILSEEGIGYDNERAAIKAARQDGWFTHRIDLKGRLKKI